MKKSGRSFLLLQCRILWQYDGTVHQLYQQCFVVTDQCLWRTAILFGRLSLGSVSSFVLYSRKFSGPINELANIFSDLQSALAAAERIFRLLDEEPEVSDVPDAYEFTEVTGRIQLDHVSFGYQKDRMIIRTYRWTLPQAV